MQRSQIFVQNRVFCLCHLHSTPPLEGFPYVYCHAENIFIRFGTIHERVGRTDRQTHRQTPHDDISRAYASHRAAKIVQCAVSRIVAIIFGGSRNFTVRRILGIFPADFQPAIIFRRIRRRVSTRDVICNGLTIH